MKNNKNLIKKFKNFYFYVQSPRDFLHAYNLKKLLQKLGYKNFYLVITKDDYSHDYQWGSFIKDYLKIYYVENCNIGNIKNRFNFRGLVFFSC